MTTWHAEPAALAAYADGALDDVRASSLEAHLMSCSACRTALASAVPAAPLHRARRGVTIATVPPPPRHVEPVLLRAGVRHDDAPQLAATPPQPM
jgi:anti-sigma factor RsiW